MPANASRIALQWPPEGPSRPVKGPDNCRNPFKRQPFSQLQSPTNIYDMRMPGETITWSTVRQGANIDQTCRRLTSQGSSASKHAHDDLRDGGCIGPAAAAAPARGRGRLRTREVWLATRPGRRSATARAPAVPLRGRIPIGPHLHRFQLIHALRQSLIRPQRLQLCPPDKPATICINICPLSLSTGPNGMLTMQSSTRKGGATF